MSQQDAPRMRASDAEREQVVAAVRHAMSEGRLSLAEGEQRMAAAYAATFQDELPPLTADLPPDPAGAAAGAGSGHRSSAGAGAGPGGWRGGPWRHPGHRRPGPRMGSAILLGGLAVGVGAVVLATGGPLWPAIVLGVVVLVLFKHRWYGRGCGRTGPESA